MLKFFTGEHEYKVEPRGRVSIPSEFRKVLDELSSTYVYIVPQMARIEAHTCFSLPGWQVFVRQIEGKVLPKTDKDALRAATIGKAKLVPIDDAGRIVLSEKLRNLIGVKKDVMFFGVGSTFELWEPDTWRAHHEPQAARGMEIAAKLDLSELHG
ncbi:MAG: hypothetical protein AAF713_13735 [Pseudomonadota bacterium]